MNLEAGLMYVKCAYCGDWMDSKEGPINAISHGCCDPCFEEQKKELDGMNELENSSGFLDGSCNVGVLAGL